MSDWPPALQGAEEAGRQAALAYLQDPGGPAASPLSGFSDGVSPLGAGVIRGLLSLGVPLRVVALVPFAWLGRGARAKALRVLGKFAFWSGVRAGLHDPELLARLTRGTLVLMYHAVGCEGEPPSTYVVPLRRFQRQMAWLRFRRRPVLTLEELVAHLRAHRPPPAGAVVITFDDGYADNHDVALPVLKEHRFRATVFMVSAGVGGVVSWTADAALRRRPLLTSEHLAALRAAGFEIGGHSRTHASLTDLSPDGRLGEIAGCRDELERVLAAPVRSFAYPFGDYDADVMRTLREAGYEGACCSRSGLNELGAPLFEIRRVEVRGTDSWWRFVRMVWSGRRSRRSDRNGVGGRTARRP